MRLRAYVAIGVGHLEHVKDAVEGFEQFGPIVDRPADAVLLHRLVDRYFIDDSQAFFRLSHAVLLQAPGVNLTRSGMRRKRRGECGKPAYLLAAAMQEQGRR